MPTRTQHITHRFGGGWAPDYGKLVSDLPTQTGSVSIPFTLEAKNIFWNLDGGFKQVGGTAKTSLVLESGAEIMGLYDYWRIGTSGTYARRKVCHVGQFIYEDGGTDTWVKVGVATYTTLQDAKHPNYATFNDLLIISSDGNTDVPMSWDQTTFQNLAGSPPNFAFSTEHKGRLWAAGVAANPSRLYYSGKDNPELWTPTASAIGAPGYIDISPGDGDEIRGIASFKDELWVFKGPNKGSIHRITGSSPSDFSRILFIRGLACVGHSTIVPFKDDILFMTPSGSIRSLKATAAFGDYNDAAITFPINQWLIDNLTKSALKTAWAVNDPTTSHLYVAVPTAAATTNNLVLCYDYQFTSIQQPDRWSRITDWPVHCLANMNISGLPTVYGGGTDGFIRSTNIAANSIDATTPMTPVVATPFMNYGSSIQYKTIATMGFTVSPVGDDMLTFKWVRDSTYDQTATISQGAVDGVALGVFVLDVDKLTGGVGRINELYYEMEEGGEFRWIQYQIENNVLNDDLVVHAFLAGLQFDAVSTE